MITAPRLSFARAARSLKNRRTQAVRLRFFPAGEELCLEPGATARIVATGPAGGELEIVRGAGEWRIYAWPGASVRVVRTRATVLELETAPRLPDGMTTRAWCDAMERDVLDRAG